MPDGFASIGLGGLGLLRLTGRRYCVFKKEPLGLQYTREIESRIAASVEKVEMGTRVVEQACRTMKDVVTNANPFAFALHN
jgi:hypothetical protein